MATSLADTMSDKMTWVTDDPCKVKSIFRCSLCFISQALTIFAYLAYQEKTLKRLFRIRKKKWMLSSKNGCNTTHNLCIKGTCVDCLRNKRSYYGQQLGGVNILPNGAMNAQ